MRSESRRARVSTVGKWRAPSYVPHEHDPKYVHTITHSTMDHWPFSFSQRKLDDEKGELEQLGELVYFTYATAGAELLDRHDHRVDWWNKLHIVHDLLLVLLIGKLPEPSQRRTVELVKSKFAMVQVAEATFYFVEHTEYSRRNEGPWSLVTIEEPGCEHVSRITIGEKP